MRKINMKRRSKKSLPEEVNENGAAGESEKSIDGEESANQTLESSTTSRKKRKSGSGSTSPRKKGKHNKKDESADEGEEKNGTDKETDEEESEDQYEVEKVLDEKFIRGVRHFLIRWKGYEPESDSWEPEETVTCPELITKFREEHGSGKSAKGKDRKSKSADKKSKQHKKKDKKASKENEAADWASDEEFEVERILEVHHRKDGKREFFVQWKGYPKTESSWEPEDNLDCTDLINKFMQRVDKAKSMEEKELRTNRKVTERFTLSTNDAGRRLSRRLGSKQRVQYHDAE